MEKVSLYPDCHDENSHGQVFLAMKPLQLAKKSEKYHFYLTVLAEIL
jgi:hypothetical protein